MAQIESKACRFSRSRSEVERVAQPSFRAAPLIAAGLPYLKSQFMSTQGQTGLPLSLAEIAMSAFA